MQKKRVLLGLALFAVGCLLLFSLFTGHESRSPSPKEGDVAITNEADRGKKTPPVKRNTSLLEQGEDRQSVGESSPEDVNLLREAVLKWEGVIDDMLSESQTLPFAERGVILKEALDKLPESEWTVGLHTLLNELPDEKFGIVGSLLLNKSGDPKLLTELFDDMLNRPAEVKNSYILVISQCEGHPEQASARHIVETTAIAEEVIGEENKEETANE